MHLYHLTSTILPLGDEEYSKRELSIYNMHTGKKLAVAKSDGWLPEFTLDGKGVWCAGFDGDEVDQWAILKDDRSNIKLEKLRSTKEPLNRFQSSYGYQVTDGGWILNPSGKHLLWLPQQWRSQRRWGRKILVLAQGGLSETIILELEV